LFVNHEILLKGLEERIGSWSPESKLGDLFIDQTDFLVRYRHYINNYNTALATLQQNMKIPEFKAFVQAREAQPECQHSDLQTFLLGPIQRIPRYEMLLRDLLRKTDKDHADYNNIKAALNKIEDIMLYINEQKRNSDQILKVEHKLGERVAQSLWLSNRKYIAEGTLITTSSRSEKERYAFLFNNLLLLCKLDPPPENGEPAVDLYHVKETIGIEGQLIVLPWRAPVNVPHSFVHIEISRKKYMFRSTTVEDTKKWHENFIKVRDEKDADSIGNVLKTNRKLNATTDE